MPNNPPNLEEEGLVQNMNAEATTVDDSFTSPTWMTQPLGKRIFPRGFLPMFDEAKDSADAIYGLLYILQQIQATNSYKPTIGQVTSATSSLEFAIRALRGDGDGTSSTPDDSGKGNV
jgi:hypothetical protein